MKVVIDISDEDFRELLKRTKAENIKEAVETAVEEFLLSASPDKAKKERTKVEKYLSLLRGEVLEKIDGLVEQKLEEIGLNEKINKILTAKLNPIRKEVEKLKKAVKDLENDLYVLKQEVSGLPTTNNLNRLKREMKVLEAFLADQIRNIRKEIEREKFLKAVEEINRTFPFPAELKITAEEGDWFTVEVESKALEKTPFSEEYLKGLLKERGFSVLVRKEKDCYKVKL